MKQIPSLPFPFPLNKCWKNWDGKNEFSLDRGECEQVSDLVLLSFYNHFVLIKETPTGSMLPCCPYSLSLTHWFCYHNVASPKQTFLFSLWCPNYTIMKIKIKKRGLIFFWFVEMQHALLNQDMPTLTRNYVYLFVFFRKINKERKWEIKNAQTRNPCNIRG